MTTSKVAVRGLYKVFGPQPKAVIELLRRPNLVTAARIDDPGAARLPANYPPHAEARMIRNDLAWMAENRPRILAEWTRRYDAKAEHPPEPR